MRDKILIGFYVLVFLFGAFFMIQTCETTKPTPTVNHIKVSEVKTKPLRDSICIYKHLVDSLKSVKRGVKLVPYSVLVKDTIYLDSACNIVARGLLNQIAKRDTIIKSDSVIILGQDKQISLLKQIDTINTNIIKGCQVEKDSIKTVSDKKILKAENKTKKVGVIATILVIFALLL